MGYVPLEKERIYKKGKDPQKSSHTHTRQRRGTRVAPVPAVRVWRERVVLNYDGKGFLSIIVYNFNRNYI